MENKEKVEKIICVLNTNFDKLTLSGDMVTYKNYELGVVDDMIMLYGTDKFLPKVTKPIIFLGIKLYDKVIKENSYERIGHLYARIDNHSFEVDVELDVYQDFYNKLIKVKEEKFINDLNKLCNGEQKV